jgi:predicted Rossmann fold flavoprotein
LKTEKDGRVFPSSDQASTILNSLVQEITRLKIKLNLNERVTGLTHIESGWKVITNKNTYWSKSVILATGGKSYPQLGSTGDGFDIVKQLGHRIIEPKPALVPLELTGNWFNELQGVKTNVEITLKSQGKTIARQTGEILFTHFGISGPVVLDLSHLIIECLPKPDIIVSVNFLPGYNSNQLNQFLNSIWLNQPRKTLANSLSGLMPKKLVSVLLNEMKMIETLKVNQLTKKDKHSFTERLSKWQLAVKRPRSFDESMVTAGGVSMNEINTRTMESLKVKGLYLAGEVLDIDGISGGYNLQFAWSTGYLAGLQE